MTVIDAYLEALLDGAPPPTKLDVAAPDAQAVANPAATTAAAEPQAEPAPEPVSTPIPVPAPSPSPAPTAAPAPAPVSPPAPTLTPIPAAHGAPTPAEPAAPSSQRWLRVAVGGDGYALELLRVQEVVRMAPIVAIRGANRAVLGVMNLRGRIVPVFDLGLWLEAGRASDPGHADDGRRRIVVIERDDELIGLLVSAVEDVITLARDRIEPSPADNAAHTILGIARVGDAPTVLLDAGVLFKESAGNTTRPH